MKLHQKLAALFLVSACSVSTVVNAQESNLEQLVTSYVKSAVNSVSQDIDIQLEKSLLSASHLVSFNSESVPATKVSITDLKADAKEALKKDDKTNNTDEKDTNVD